MPIYNPHHLEHMITTGNIRIMCEDGDNIPAYWAHPAAGARFPGAVLVHHWWGMTDVMRRFANQLATVGYYVVVPDLFDERTARTPDEARALLAAMSAGRGFRRMDAALSVLEAHTRTNGQVAVIGFGLGGSLAFQAAIQRSDLEAAVSFYGLPQPCFGHFGRAKAPIMAIYGEQDDVVPPDVVAHLEDELAHTPLAGVHKVLRVPGVSHDFVVDAPTPAQRTQVGQVWDAMMTFLDAHLVGRPRNPRVQR